MTRRAEILLICLWMCLSANLVAPVQAQPPESDAPYLYYFDNELLAFVIERADGTDRHILGDGLMVRGPEVLGYYIDGPGWSPSGRWFAWTAEIAMSGGFGGHRRKPYLVSADGNQRLRLLDDLEDATMVWSPDADLLMVAAQYYIVEQSTPEPPLFASTGFRLRTFIALVNPLEEAPHVVVDLLSTDTTPFGTHALLSPTVVWTPDGERAIVAYRLPDPERGEERTALQVVDRLGNRTSRVIDSPMLFEYWSQSPPVSTLGWYAYLIGDALFLENVLTEEQQTFTLPPVREHMPPWSLTWDPTGRYGVLSGPRILLLVPERKELTPLFEQPDRASTIERALASAYWSPESRHAILPIETPGRTSLFHLDPAASTLEVLPFGADTYTGGWSWIDSKRAVIASRPQTVDERWGIWLLDFREGAAQVLNSGLGRGMPQLSPDSRYLASMFDGPVILDLRSSEIRKFRSHAFSYFTGLGGEVYWSRDSQWLIARHDGLIAGGGYYRWISVLSADGAVNRDLTFTWGPTAATVGWLPGQVDPAQIDELATTPEPHPVRTLHGTDWPFALTWSPDGHRLTSDVRWARELVVWDVESGTLLETHPYTTPQDNGPLRVLSPDGRHEIVAQPRADRPAEWIIVAREVDSGQILHELDDAHNAQAASYSPDGRYVAVGNAYECALIWDTRSWKAVATLPTPATALAFSPDGTRLAANRSWDIDIWDVATLLAEE